MKSRVFLGVSLVLASSVAVMAWRMMGSITGSDLGKSSLSPNETARVVGEGSDTRLPISAGDLAKRLDAGKDLASDEDSSELRAAAVVGSVLAHRSIPTDEQLEAKYAHIKGREFIGAEKGFALFYHECTEALLRDKFDKGDYVSKIVALGDKVTSSVERASWPGKYPPAESIRMVPIGNDLQEFQMAHIFPSENPTLVALMVELEWLSNKAREHY